MITECITHVNTPRDLRWTSNVHESSSYLQLHEHSWKVEDFPILFFTTKSD